MDGEKSAIMNDFGPKDAILAAPKKKEPPSETTNSIRTRGLVLVSYWAIVLLLGLPMWWKQLRHTGQACH
jgi:phosphatidylinositol glycan class S